MFDIKGFFKRICLVTAIPVFFLSLRLQVCAMSDSIESSYSYSYAFNKEGGLGSKFSTGELGALAQSVPNLLSDPTKLYDISLNSNFNYDGAFHPVIRYIGKLEPSNGTTLWLRVVEANKNSGQNPMSKLQNSSVAVAPHEDVLPPTPERPWVKFTSHDVLKNHPSLLAKDVGKYTVYIYIQANGCYLNDYPAVNSKLDLNNIGYVKTADPVLLTDGTILPAGMRVTLIFSEGTEPITVKRLNGNYVLYTAPRNACLTYHTEQGDITSTIDHGNFFIFPIHDF